MSGALASLVGKRILAESARNHFGQEVSALKINNWNAFLCILIRVLSRIRISKKFRLRDSTEPSARRHGRDERQFHQDSLRMIRKSSPR
jgi:hypothetical protein